MIKKMVSLAAAIAISVVAFANTSFAAFGDYYSNNVVLYQGSSGSNVVSLQNDLKRLGFYNSYADGSFGPYTARAVMAYQKNNNLVADGVVGHYTAREITVDKVLQTAKSFQGVPYVWGGTSPSGFDCSGFTHYVLLQSNIIIPRTADQQYNAGTWVDKSQLQPGDLVFFTTYKPGPSHVGFYLGNNKFIHASSGADQVKISDMTTSYYTQRYIGAKRIIK